ncbi:MAG: glutathione synthase [Pseudomonadota bacterium]
MALRVAIQTDPLETADVASNTSFALAEAAQAEGHTLYEYQADHLSYDQGRISAPARPLKVQRIPGDPTVYGDPVNLDLRTDIDVVLMRQDPPFDMGYITACHILEMLAGETLVVNDPAHVRSGPEKLYPLDKAADFMPPTLVSRDRNVIYAFRAEHKDVILKPLYGFGGGDVFHVKPGDSNFGALVDLFLARTREPMIVQAFLPAVSAGDKRIILINGEPIGGFNRVPLKGHARSNLAVGGTAEPSDLTDDDLAICRAIGPDLRAKGQILVGIDVIGGRLTEVNNTSPTGVQQVRDFTGRDPALLFWQVVQDKLANA